MPQRIVSLAPSITETLFALGLGDKVVGVTRACDYPPEAAGIAKTGAFLDPSFEAVVALRPDLVVLPSSGVEAQRELAKLHLRTLMAPQQTLAGIHQSIRLIGGACGARAAADALLSQLTRRAAAVRRAVAGRPRPRVLICVGRDTASGQLAGMSMAGAHTFYDEIIRAAGGTNACADTAATYPEFSAEGVLQTNPEVIVDLVGMLPKGGRPAA
ncbi:MAG: ABC transporter substrate-binding protein, partial [Armatimonadetes bacterium]|nr:ABC transporter substrate-binding protein [Armatimonadota bacterium]